MANPMYGTTVANTALPIQVEKSVKKFWVESVNGVAPVWFTIDGSTPVALQDGSFFLPAAAGAGIPFELGAAQQVTVTFKSVGAVQVGVRYL